MDRYWLWGPVHIRLAARDAAVQIAIAKQAAGGEMPFRLSVAPWPLLVLSQAAYCCRRQKKQSPQAITNGITTRSPLRTAVTSNPLPPLPHKFMAENIAVVRAGDLSAVKMKIGTQIAVAVTRSIISSGASRAGSGMVSTLT